MASEEVCGPKEEGGHGVRSLNEMKNVSLFKLFWQVVSPSNNSSGYYNTHMERMWFCGEEVYKARFVTWNWNHIKVTWHTSLWFNHVTPKFRFCTWLACSQSYKYGRSDNCWTVGIDGRFVLCHQHLDTSYYSTSQAVDENCIGKLFIYVLILWYRIVFLTCLC